MSRTMTPAAPATDRELRVEFRVNDDAVLHS
jgi:hypothetical protein